MIGGFVASVASSAGMPPARQYNMMRASDGVAERDFTNSSLIQFGWGSADLVGDGRQMENSGGQTANRHINGERW